MTTLPAWPKRKSNEGLIFFHRADAILDAWLTYKVGWAVALGMLANAEAESKLDIFSTSSEHATPTKFGLYRWSYARAKTIKNGCGVDVINSRYPGEQVEAAMWELKYAPHHRCLGLTEMQSCWTAANAAHWGYALFILSESNQPTPDSKNRSNMARRWARYYLKRGRYQALIHSL
jgi:hypothetical protein